MSEHSVDVLTDGAWVPIRGVMRWRGTHLAPDPRGPRPRVREPDIGLCGCGRPARTERARYCTHCHTATRRATWRNSKARTYTRRAA